MSIILSIKPQFTNLILDGSKTLEMRTKIGKKFIDETDVIIYSSSPVKAIVAIAKINKIQYLRKGEVRANHLKEVCVSKEFFNQYMEDRIGCYLIEFKDIKKLKTSLSLQYLKTFGFSAPQSFCYASHDVYEVVMNSL